MAYFANGSEGEKLDQQCSECPLGEFACPIAAVQMCHNYDQIGNENLQSAMNLLVDENGLCVLRPLVIKTSGKLKIADMQKQMDDLKRRLQEAESGQMRFL